MLPVPSASSDVKPATVDGLGTLGFRVPHGVLTDRCASVVAYPLGRRFVEAWGTLPVWRHDRHEYARPRYSSLAVALGALTNRPVALISCTPSGARDVAAVLLTTVPFDIDLHRTVQVWERAVRRGRDTSVLAPLLPSTPEAWWPGDAIARAGEEACSVPPWWRCAVGWSLGARMVEQSRRVGPEHAPRASGLLPDTDGSLVAWGTADPTAPVLRLRPRLRVMPRSVGVVVVIEARLVPVQTRWPGARHAWVRGDGGGFVRRIRVQSVRDTGCDRWDERPADYLSELLEACGRSPIDLPEDLSVPGCPVSAFADLAGTPPSARLLADVHRLVRDAVPGLEELVVRPAVVRCRRSGGVRSPVATAGPEPGDRFPQLHVLCAYATAAGRRYMLSQLATLAGTPVPELSDCVTTDIGSGIRITTNRCPEVLRNGLHDRTSAVAALAGLRATADVTTVGWLETTAGVAKSLPRRHDARPALRRLLARHGVPVVFLDGVGAHGAGSGTGPSVNDPEHGTVSALLRQAGRPAGVWHSTGSSVPDCFPVTVIGIHSRVHRHTRGGRLHPVCTMVAARIVPGAAPRRIRMYVGEHGWGDYPSALARYHAGPVEITGPARGGDVRQFIRNHVEGALRQIGGCPVVVADVSGNDMVWPGLVDHRFGRAGLPGDSAAGGGRGIALVRCSVGADVPQSFPAELPPGLSTGDGSADPSLHRFSGLPADVWCVPDSAAPLEIAVARSGQWEEQALAELAAALCVTADGPLALAAAADWDHPYSCHCGTGGETPGAGHPGRARRPTRHTDRRPDDEHLRCSL